MGCGCKGGKKNNISRGAKASGLSRLSRNKNSSNVANTTNTARTSSVTSAKDKDRKRVQALRKQAILKALGHL